MSKREIPSGPLQTPRHFLRLLTEVDAQIGQILEPVNDDLNEVVQQLVGKSFGSFEANRRVARQVLLLLNQLLLGFECRREGCGEPARLVCVPAPPPRPWTFQFEHLVAGRTIRHGGSGSFPPLTLVHLVRNDEVRRVRSPVIPKPRSQSVTPVPTETPEQVLVVLAGIEKHMESILEPIGGKLQGILQPLVGRAFSSYDANHRVIRQVLRLLKRLRLGLECQRPGCAKPAVLRCLPSMGTQPWTFEFEHYVEGRQFRHTGGWTRFPPLKLVPTVDTEHDVGASVDR